MAEGPCSEKLCVCTGYFSCSASFSVFFVWGAVARSFCQLLIKKIKNKKGGRRGGGGDFNSVLSAGISQMKHLLLFFK